jgi:aminopeptidase N
VVVPLAEPPSAVRLDPDYHLFRRVARSEMAPVLNLYVTDGQRSVVLAQGSPAQPGPFGDILQRIVAQESAKPDAVRTIVLQPGEGNRSVPSGSLLVLGDPRENPIAAAAVRSCGDRVRFLDGGFSVAGKMYEGAAMALLVSCRREEHPGSVVTLLYGVTPQALGRVARLLFFYGWQSYVVFQEGAVVARGDWEDRMNTEVRIETR